MKGEEQIMETVRDIVIIMFGLTATVSSLALLFMGLHLYQRASQALQRVGRTAEEVHGAVEGARRGVRLASRMVEIGGSVLPGLGWLTWTHRGAAALPRVVRSISRFKRRKASIR